MFKNCWGLEKNVAGKKIPETNLVIFSLEQCFCKKKSQTNLAKLFLAKLNKCKKNVIVEKKLAKKNWGHTFFGPQNSLLVKKKLANKNLWSK